MALPQSSFMKTIKYEEPQAKQLDFAFAGEQQTLTNTGLQNDETEPIEPAKPKQEPYVFFVPYDCR